MLKIAQLGQPVLRQVASPVPLAELQSPEFQEFIDGMLITLKAEEGAGLAAPQVYVSKRVFIAGIIPAPEGEDPGVVVCINPKLRGFSRTRTSDWEGCLSYRELMCKVPRFENVTLTFFDREGQQKVMELEGIAARIVQHEYDHLEGVLTLDRVATTHDIMKTTEYEEIYGKDEEGNPKPKRSKATASAGT